MLKSTLVCTIGEHLRSGLRLVALWAQWAPMASLRQVLFAPLPGGPHHRTVGAGSWAFLVVLIAALATGRLAVAQYVDSLTDVLVGVSLAAVVFVLARWVGHLTRAELGFTNTVAGAVWGLGFAALVGLAGLAAVFIEPVRTVVLASAPPPAETWWWAAFFVVPLGTVLFEEVVFRGVLWGAAARVMPTWAVLLTTSALFSLWHVPPLLYAPAALDGVGLGGQLAATLTVTFVGGLVFGGLRAASNSVLSPIFAHIATNSVGVGVVTFAAYLS